LDGFAFSFQDFELSSVFSLINVFGLSSLLQFISTQIQISQTLPSCLTFLSHVGSDILNEQFQSYLIFLISNIENISIDHLNSLPNFILDQILNSETLIVPNEDFLFHLITQLISLNKNRIILLKYIQFQFVSADLLTRFFQNFSSFDLDFDVFESLKPRLFSEILVITDSKQDGKKLQNLN
jgi:hypothetical protein